MSLEMLAGVPQPVWVLTFLLLISALAGALADRPTTRTGQEEWRVPHSHADDDSASDADAPPEPGGDEPGAWLPGADWSPE